MALIDNNVFEEMRQEYESMWGCALCLCDVEGHIINGLWACISNEPAVCGAKRLAALEAAMTYGESTVLVCHNQTWVWAIPLMVNARAEGALVASALERDIFPMGEPPARINVRAAATDLRLKAEKQNPTNAAFLTLSRQRYFKEKEFAEAIHEFKMAPYDDILMMYLGKENELMAAIRRDDRGQARKIINNMLVAMLHRSGESLSLIKTFFLQLIVAMCRTAVESGGNPEQLLGANFQSLQDLAQIDSDEKLAPWLHRILDHVMDSIRDTHGRPASVPIFAAIDYMTKHLGEDISREDIAQAAHLSPFHFSRLFKENVGVGVRERLTQMRIERTAELMVRTDKPLVEIALECGFKDQSYFTKTFRRLVGVTPKAYRSKITRSKKPQNSI